MSGSALERKVYMHTKIEGSKQNRLNISRVLCTFDSWFSIEINVFLSFFNLVSLQPVIFLELSLAEIFSTNCGTEIFVRI